jgi:pimeloyl-ACP methyl ester carboxylesterase
VSGRVVRHPTGLNAEEGGRHVSDDDVLRTTVPVTIRGRTIRVSCLRREGAGPPVLILPGLGMPAVEALGIAPERVLPGRALLVPDIPGTGHTRGMRDLTVEDLATLAAALLGHLDAGPAVVVGHSMGGLTGLFLCRDQPGLVAGFVNVEGNLGPGDCFVSRRVVVEPIAAVAASLGRSRAAGMVRYARTLADVRDAGTLRSVSRSLVEHSTSSPLLAWFTRLEVSRLFITGASGRELPYLGTLRAAGVPVVSLGRCGHFPMYSRPAAYYRAVEEFVERVGSVTAPV